MSPETEIHDDTSGDFTIRWTNIRYSITNSWFMRTGYKFIGKSVPEVKHILSGVSGQLKCGQMMGIMGPSGSGKTILMECLIGKLFNGASGCIECLNIGSRRMKISYIPQADKVFDTLTVREAVLFSCKLQNTRGDPSLHQVTTQRILSQLGLEICADTRIGRCSGGQQKRVSIAMELVAKPSVLVLDEPTSGLDSRAANVVISHLAKVAKSEPRVAIFVTIHQPNWEIFEKFDQIYLMTKTSGKILYEGQPSGVPNHLVRFNITYPDLCNPADVLMEVACGCFGQDVIQEMTRHQELEYKDIPSDRVSFHPPLSAVNTEPDYPFMSHFWILFLRSLLLSVRDPWMISLRLVASLIVIPVLGITFKDAGKGSGCPPEGLIDIHNMTYDEKFFEKFVKRDQELDMYLADNNALIFYASVIGIFIGVMPVVMTFPSELPALIKESFNKWYIISTYYLAKFTAEAPFLIVYNMSYIICHYYINEEPTEVKRMITYAAINLMYAFTAQSHGLLVSVFFLDAPAAGVYIASASMVPMILLTGFFARFKDVSQTVYYISFFTYERFAVESSLLAIYGFDRCGQHPERTVQALRHGIHEWIDGTREQMVNLWRLTYNPFHVGHSDPMEVYQLKEIISHKMLDKYYSRSGHVTSQTLASSDLSDDDMGPNILYLILLFFIYRLVSYFILFRRIHRRN